MRKIKNILAIATIATMTFSMVGCKMIEKTPEAIQKTVLAKVGDEKITMADVNGWVKSRYRLFNRDIWWRLWK